MLQQFNKNTTLSQILKFITNYSNDRIFNLFYSYKPKLAIFS